MKTLNLKETIVSTQQAVAIVEIEIEQAKREGLKSIKIVHGYGSHGVGGVISVEVKKYLYKLKRHKIIKDILTGDEWDISSSKAQELIKKDKCYGDEDLNHRNPGITIIEL